MPQDTYHDGYTHEVMHAAHICCDMWDSHVADTRCSEEYPDVREAIERAAQAMYNVYQLIGQKIEPAATVQPTPAAMERQRMTPDEIQIMKAIKTLAEVALDCEDVDLLHQHLREIINAANKALKPPSS